jgi:hypothetical protein
MFFLRHGLIQVKATSPQLVVLISSTTNKSGGMAMHDFAEFLASTAFSHNIQTAGWIIPLSQSLHIMAVAVVLSSMAMIDLRIFGFAARSQTMAQTAHRFVPWIWTSLVVLAFTGTLQIIAEPSRTLDGNPMFQLKMLLLAVGIIATLAFQFSVHLGSAFWDDPRRRSVLHVLAGTSFLLWCTVTIAGRWIAYFQGA